MDSWQSLSHCFSAICATKPSEVAFIEACKPEKGDTISRASSRPDAFSLAPDVQHGGDCVYTYQQLNEAVDVLSQYLQREVPLTNDSIRNLEEGAMPTRVAVLLPRSANYVVAILSVLRAGLAFVPIDTAWPRHRQSWVLNHCTPSKLITSPEVPPFDPPLGCPILTLPSAFASYPSDSHLTVSPTSSSPSPNPNPKPFSYILYTSGSTGHPKGVCGTEGGLINRLQWMAEKYPFAGVEVCLFKTGVGFIDHLTELLGPLLAGVPIVAPPVETPPAELLPYLRKYKITRLVAVPSLLQSLLPHFEEEQQRQLARQATAVVRSGARQLASTAHDSVPSHSDATGCGVSAADVAPSGACQLAANTATSAADVAVRQLALSLVVSSGEALSWKLLDRLRAALPKAHFLNLYGSTEVSGDCTYYQPDRQSNGGGSGPWVPIGYPIVNHGCHIMDENGAPLDGVGELFVGGPGLAWGYWNEPVLTQGAFVERGVLGRRFRTGDLVRMSACGGLLWVGRKGRQVKVRGHRVEPAEVEAALLAHPDVRQVAVQPWPGGICSADRAQGAADVAAHATADKPADVAAELAGAEGCGLVAYVALDSHRAETSGTSTETRLRQLVADKLPQAFVPSTVVILKELPLTVSGKVDWAALPEPDWQAQGDRGGPADVADAAVAEDERSKSVLERVQEVFAEVLGFKSCSPHLHFFNAGGRRLIWALT